MNFGPLNRTGGERRLNVAVTRARRALRVYSTLTADQIDLSKTNATGARHLKAFLQYVAQHGGAAGEAPVRRAGFDSPFERAVYDALVARGYTVDCQVGCGGYRVDLAVTHPDHPGVYAIGVECDGAAYHAAPTARDRDRLRAEVLQGLGWRLHRVWSSDWWFDRARESAKLFAAVEAAIAAPVEVEAAAPVATVPVAAAGVDQGAAPEAAAAPMVAEAPASAPYVYASLATVGEPEAFDLGAARAAIRARILEVVAIEAPLSLDELARRVSAAWGITRLTAKPRERVRVEAEALAALGKLQIVDGFAWAPGVDPAAWTTVRGAAADGTTRPAEALPVEEIAAAAARVLATDLAIDVAGLHGDIGRALGFARVGTRLDERLTAGVDVLVRAGRARRDGERVVWVG
jgi:very-short-patch-repair endonuclease